MKKIKNTANIIIPIFAVFILFHLIFSPKEMLDASAKGLLLWFNVVLPSIFPFLVTVSLLSSTNITDILGKVLAPVMKPLFKVSGSSAFPYILGVLSGYPLGAKIVCDMEKSKKITPTEAQRLMAFVNNPSPLFVIGTVATGMLNNSLLGYVLLLSTFLGATVTGVFFRFYKPIDFPSPVSKRSKNIIPPIGKLLNTSVYNSVVTITTIGGFIIFFSVIAEALKLSGVLGILSQLLSGLFLNKIPVQYFESVFIGLLEMTSGIKSLSLAGLPIDLLLPTTAFLLSFGGFSIIAQTISVVSDSSIKTGTYIFSKLINAVCSFCICKILLIVTKPFPAQASTVFSEGFESFYLFFQYSLVISLCLLATLLLLNVFYKFLAK